MSLQKLILIGLAASALLNLFSIGGSLAIIFVPLAMEILGQVRNVALHMSIAPVAKVVFISVLIPIVAGIGVHKLVLSFSERVAKPL